MSHSVYTAIVDLGELDDEDRRDVDSKINQALYDLLDEMGLEYHVLTSMVIDSEETLSDPAANELGGFHRDDPDTSRKAALDNYPRSGSQRWKCLMAIAEAGLHGATFDELREELGMYSADRRLPELHEGGWIEPSGRERKTRHDSAAIVYVLTDRARRHLEVKEGIAV